MNVSPVRNIKQSRLLSAVLIVGLLGLLGLQGCGSSSTPETVVPIADQNASGLFKSGTAELNSGATMLDDLRAFVHEGRIIMFSINGHLLFDGQITNITGDDYTATVDVYEIGVKTQSAVSVTGKVTTKSGITGTIAGAGDASGTFTLTFDPAYNLPSTTDAITSQPADWEGDLINEFSFIGDSQIDSAELFRANVGDPIKLFGSILNSNDSVTCGFDGDVSVPNSDLNLYTLSLQLPSDSFNIAECPLPLSKEFTGFVTVLSEAAVDNELMLAFTGEGKTFFGIIKQP